MQNDYIIPTGIPDNTVPYEEQNIPESKYLEIDNQLKELVDKNYQEQARHNLGVPSNQELENLSELLSDLEERISNIKEGIDNRNKELSNSIHDIKDELETFVKTDGSRAFNGEMPVYGNSALITEDSVNNKLKSYSTKTDVSNSVEKALLDVANKYAEKNKVWDINNSYSKSQVDQKLNNEYVSKDLLKEKGYVNLQQVKNKIKEHNQEYNAHNFEDRIKDLLKGYCKRSEVWSRSCTYNRGEINSIIEKLVDSAYEDVVEHHLNTTHHLNELEIRGIVDNYAEQHLVNNQTLINTITKLQSECEKQKPIWRTSGPVLTTVGFVEDNTVLAEELTLQQILDHIFYGSDISISADENIGVNEMVDVTMCLRMGLPVKSIILYMNGNPIDDDFVLEDFEEGCVTRQYGPITEDTEFVFEVIQDNSENTKLSQSTTVKVQYPIFVGTIPKMKAESTLTLSYLNKSLIKKDDLNNEWVYDLPVVHKYNFKDPSYQKLIVGIPTNYNKELDYMTNQIQTFTKDAFNFHRTELTFQLDENNTHAEHYDFYIYNQPLSSLDSLVTFNFVDRK